MSRDTYLVPAAIIVAGLLLSLAIYSVRTGTVPLATPGDPSHMRPVSPEDHIVGNPKASIVIVEYSDIDCTFCKDFQGTMTQLMADYAATGKVAWVYRHFPVVDLHPYAAEHAEAAECLASLGGEPLFFRFIDLLQQAAPAGTQFMPSNYPDIVGGLGISLDAFNECMESNRFLERVANDYDNALDSGASGTPFIVILAGDAPPVPVSGALPYDSMKQVIEELLRTTP